MNYENLSGRQFNNLEVIEQADDFVSPTNGKRERMWKCKCLLCGTVVITRERNLKSGHIKSCGKKHRRVTDLVGQHFGDLEVIERAPNTYSGIKRVTSYVMWKCRCKCNREIVTRATSLMSGHTTSCGICSRSESNMGKGLNDISHQKFGYWTVLGKSRSLIEPRGRRVTLWKCQCRCGEIRELRAGTLKEGLSYSCGCYASELRVERASHGIGISKSEKLVSNFLTEHDIYFEPQKMYPDLRGDFGYPLSYDFLVYKNFEPLFLIECQGKQHYEPIEFFGGEKQFAIQKKNDGYKKQYAVNHNLPLLEIPYWYSDEESIDVIQNMIKTL